ncbi:MAG TPA: glycosyltransferase family 4 protein [Candidatus Methylomirabilis sp.]|nr:glycosyltransferase family 4 protein [Candidatus Methylomirabilis sp.]
MKIAQIVCVYPPYKSGIGTSAFNNARVLKSAGVEVETFTLDYGRGESADQEVVRLKPFLKFGNGGFLPQLPRRLKDFDIIYLHYPFFGAAEIIWFWKKFFWKKKKKLIIHYHMDVVFSNWLTKILGLPSDLIFNSLFRTADRVIVASIDYAQSGQLAKIYQKYPEKFVEIPYGVDTERFKPIQFVIPTKPELARASEGIPYRRPENFKGSLGSADAPLGMTKKEDDKFKILFVGGLDKAHYFKGIDILLQAASELNKEGKNFILDIVGSGDLAESYQEKARTLGLAEKVNFWEKVSFEELPEKYRAADCLVLPSINKGEAFGIVLIEAMATGIPVIASDLPGVRGVFTSESGLKIKSGDVEDLKNKIKILMDNPAKRLEMGMAARKLAEEKYSWEKVGQKLIREIEK